MERIFISWGREAELSKYLARALDAKFEKIYFKKIVGIPMLAVIRYPLQGVWTFVILLIARPKLVIVQNPPIFAAFIALLYIKTFRAKLMIDTHTAAFLDKKWVFFHWLFKFVARHADLNTCHNYKNLEVLKKWGIKKAMVAQFFNPEYDRQKLSAPLANQELAAKLKSADFPIMMVNRFANDDDWQTVVKTASLMPEADFFITGQASPKIKKFIKNNNPGNIFLTGYLDHQEFIKLMAGCEVILAFTLRLDTVLWSIREILSLGKPFVTTESEVLKHYFGDVGLFVRSQDSQDLKAKILAARAEKEIIIQKQRAFLGQDKKRWERDTQEIKNYLQL